MSEGVYFAIPTIDMRMIVPGMFAIFEAQVALERRGVRTAVDYSVSSDICQSRALLADKFMAKREFSRMLMVDSDLLCHNAAEAVVKLYDSSYPVCGGAYPKKKLGDPEFTVDEEPHGASVNGFRAKKHIGGGWLMIHRAALEKMRRTYPELTTDESKALKGFKFTSFFQNGIIDGIYRSEDSAFCYRWCKMGGSVWVLEDIKFTHFGNFGWEGNWAEMLKREETKEIAA